MRLEPSYVRYKINAIYLHKHENLLVIWQCSNISRVSNTSRGLPRLFQYKPGASIRSFTVCVKICSTLSFIYWSICAIKILFFMLRVQKIGMFPEWQCRILYCNDKMYIWIKLSECFILDISPVEPQVNESYEVKYIIFQNFLKDSWKVRMV